MDMGVEGAGHEDDGVAPARRRKRRRDARPHDHSPGGPARRDLRPCVCATHTVVPRDGGRRAESARRTRRRRVTATDAPARDALLASVIDAIGRNGLGARSLRDLASDAGTSHRMLIHHFGSREGLLVAIVTEVEARQSEVLRLVAGDAGSIAASVWQRVATPELWPFERLFFECYARGAQGEEPFNRLIPALVENWLIGLKGRERDEARLALAVVRGLLLDLVATEDRAAVDRAMKEFVRMLAVA